MAAVMLASIFSLLSAGVFVMLQAVDVAFTEAAVGAGVTTVLLLGTVALAGHREKVPMRVRFGPLVVVVATGAALIYGTFEMPRFGDPEAPANRHVAPHYIELAAVETGVPNMVYRGARELSRLRHLGRGDGDLRRRRRRTAAARRTPRALRPATMRDNVILRVIAKLLIPFILVFALYVQFHGDFGPGGGFQAGVIFAAGLILYGLIFGIDNARRVAPAAVLSAAMALGVLIFAGVGVLTLFFGGNYLDYVVLAGDFVAGQHLGILLVEIGVGVTVAAVLTAIFFAFAGRGR